MLRNLKVPALSALLLVASFSSCAPATVRTAAGNQTITVIGGLGYTLSQPIPLDKLDASVPDSQAISFKNCRGGAVKAGDVRRYGAEAAQEACQQAIERADKWTRAMSVVQLALLPLVIIAIIPLIKLIKCLSMADACYDVNQV